MTPLFNRELSWLAFNRRVLDESNNTAHPLLERVRFLAISYSNLEEFFTVRVAGLKAQQQSNFYFNSADGMTVIEQLAAIYEECQRLLAAQQEHWLSLKAQLEEAGLLIHQASNLPADDLRQLRRIFRQEILPLLTPLAIDPAHPFPFLPNKGLALALLLKDKHGQDLEAVVPLPHQLPRFIKLDSGYVMLGGVLLEFIDYLFPDCTIQGHGMLQVLRDSELEIDDEAEDLMRGFEIAIKRRRRGQPILLMVEEKMPKILRQMVTTALNIAPQDTFVLQDIVSLSDIDELLQAPFQELKFPDHTPRFPERIREYNGDCMAAIRAKDILVHHPFESFNVVIRFLEQAAQDPEVLVIKQTLYRTSKDSAIIKALIQAAENGKQVTAVVELKARFDEAANLQWARDMERAGVHVVFGFIQLKTHAKLSLVIRRENNKLINYVHCGTGNYHPINATIYTDLSYFTTNPRLAEDVRRVFNYLTGYAEPKRLKQLTIAPHGLRKHLSDLIEKEIAFAKEGKPATIWAKMNALLDTQLIEKLYEASNAGVKIELVVRGICVLKPGVEGLSENIRVKSVIGRFLEHSRLYCFGNGHTMPDKENLVYLGSADWMPRNFDFRVEACIPITNETIHTQLLKQIMAAYLKDNQQSWLLQSDGTYQRIYQKDAVPFSAHNYFLNNPSLSGRGHSLMGWAPGEVN